MYTFLLFILVDINSLWPLSLVLVLCTLIDKEVVLQRTTEDTLWQHALNSMAEHLLYTVLL